MQSPHWFAYHSEERLNHSYRSFSRNNLNKSKQSHHTQKNTLDSPHRNNKESFDSPRRTNKELFNSPQRGNKESFTSQDLRLPLRAPSQQETFR